MEKIHAVWTEKYRPSTFAEVKGQKDIVEKVEALVQQNNLPHLLFAGPAGVGKTTLALVIARQLFGDNWKSNFLELNASDERGIDVVRVKVKDFARTRALGDVPFKVIYLDECDALTKEAQQALRRTMENYTQTCRFLLSCNYSSKIIDPIQSRCAVFRFKPLSKQDVFAIIETVSGKEGLTLAEDAKNALFEASGGDCRRVENILQSCSAIDKNITAELIFSMASVARPQEVKQVLEVAVQGKFLDARNLLLDTMLKYGLSGTDIIKQVQKEILNLDIDNKRKMKILVACGEAEFRLTEGSDQYIQLEALLASMGLESQ
jgi:replication factor C small subunit